MTHDEANALAERMTRLWPRGSIDLDTWAEVIEDLHHGPVEAAIRQLRDSDETQPSIARLKHVYHGQLGTIRLPPVRCRDCGGDGWRTVKYQRNNIDYEGVKPCSCRNGDEVQDVHRRIIALNDAELARNGTVVEDDAVGPRAFPRDAA